jgi:hypothetical protein
VVADLTGVPDASFDATVYPLAIIATNAPPPADHQVRTRLVRQGGASVRQSELTGGSPWILTPGLQEIIAELECSTAPLDATTACHLGVKTGLNRVFLNPPADLEPEVLRQAVRGRDLKAFHCGSHATLLWPHDDAGRPLGLLPPRAAAYLALFEADLRARRDYEAGPIWTLFRTRAATARYRVVWPDVARQLSAVALTAGHDAERIPLNSCYIAPVRSASQAHALAAWLNSTWIRAVARVRAVPASGGFARFNAQVVGGLPLPDGALADPTLSRLGRAGHGGESVQDELDRITAQRLSLSPLAQRALRAAVDGASHDRR